MYQKVFIINSCEVKTILESEAIGGEIIHYMTDNTSYSDKQIIKLDKKTKNLLVNDLIIKIKKLKNVLIKRNQLIKDSESIFEKINNEEWKKQKFKEFEAYLNSKSTD